MLAGCQGTPGSSQDILIASMPTRPNRRVGCAPPVVRALHNMRGQDSMRIAALLLPLCAYQLSGNQRRGPQRMLPPPGPTEAEQNSRMSGVHIEDRRVIWLGLGIVQLPIVWHFLALGCLQEKEFPELRNTWHLDEIILGFNVIQLGRVW